MTNLELFNSIARKILKYLFFAILSFIVLLITPQFAWAQTSQSAGQSAQIIADTQNSLDYDQLNFLMTLHYQKFYQDTQLNQAQYQNIHQAETALYTRHASLAEEMPLRNDRDILLEGLSALLESMTGYGRDEYSLNGLKSASVLGGGVGVCEHIAPAYAQLLNTINPDFEAQTVFTITRDTTFNQGFSTLPGIEQKFAPGYEDETTPAGIALPEEGANSDLAMNINSRPQVTSISTDAELVEPLITPQSTPASIFRQTKPDHMVVQVKIALGSQDVYLYIDPTNPSFWYSDGYVLRNLYEPSIYMHYSQLGQALFARQTFQSQAELLSQTQMSDLHLQALQHLLSADRVAQTLGQIQNSTKYPQAVQTLATPSFRNYFQDHIQTATTLAQI